MTDYKRVSDALRDGAEPEMLCMTCPWDRFCITPPSMTSADVERATEEAKRRDDEKVERRRAEGKDPGMPVDSMLTIITMAGKDTSCSVCPVFALRLRTEDGQAMASTIRTHMREVAS